jgi:hypothetical protein
VKVTPTSSTAASKSKNEREKNCSRDGEEKATMTTLACSLFRSLACSSSFLFVHSLTSVSSPTPTSTWSDEAMMMRW